MRSIPGWKTSAPVVTPTTQVRMSGKDVEVDSVSLTRALPQVLPDQIVGGGGINAATGSVDMGPSATGQQPRPHTAFHGDTPMPGQSVTVDAGRANIGSSRVFTGRVDSSSGKFSSGETQVDLVDDIDHLNRMVQFDPLHTTMPPLNDGEFQWRQIGLCSTYLTDRALRKCDFYATAPMENGCVVSAPLMGSTWPERGSLQTSQKATGTWYEGPNFGGMSTGVGLWDVKASWLPSDYEKSLRWDPFQITFSANNTSLNKWTNVGIQWTNGNRVYASIGPGKGYNVCTITGGKFTNHLSTGAPNTDWSTATLRVNPVDGSFKVRFDTGYVATGSLGGAAPDAWAGKNWEAYVDSPGRTVNGFQISFPGAEEFKAVQHVPNAILTPPTSAAGPEIPELYATPAVEPVPAIDLLKDQASAELAAMWIDEDGIFRWMNRERLRGQSVKETYTSRDSLVDVSWNADTSATRRRVSVKYRDPAAQRAFRYSILAWQGTSFELSTGEYHETFIKPEEDEDWIDVNTNLRTLLPGSQPEFNKGRDTWHGWQSLDSKGDWTTVTGVDATASLRRVVPGVWNYRVRVNSLPSGVDRIKASTREGDNLLAAPYRGENLPILRCRTKITWADVRTDSKFSGPSWASDLEHDASWWVQSASEVQHLADEIGEELTKPSPVIRDVEIIADPRLQLGDKITIKDPDITGVTITGIVNEIKQKIGADDHTMDLVLMVTDLHVPTTLGAFDREWSGKSLGELDAYWSGKTLGDLDSTY